METNGLSVQVYRCKYDHSGDCDCTNGGITSKMNSLILGGVPNCPFTGDENNTVVLVERCTGYVCAVPVKQPEGMCGPMFGGNFIYSSDSRFPSNYPIPVHDRFEAWSDVDYTNI
jgi:hypothetical protein